MLVDMLGLCSSCARLRCSCVLGALEHAHVALRQGVVHAPKACILVALWYDMHNVHRSHMKVCALPRLVCKVARGQWQPSWRYPVSFAVKHGKV